MSCEGHVGLVGAGNIGSALAVLLARLPCVRRLSIVDPDIFSVNNLAGQAILRSDVGKPKAEALRRHIKRIRSTLDVRSLIARAEDLPLRALECDVLCSCLDSRLSRMQVINDIAWRLGIPVVDAGVLASQELVRVEVFAPGPDAPCYECTFTEEHYRSLEVRHPCGGPETASTNAPAFLGSLAASLQAAECEKLLIKGHSTLAGVQLLISLASHTQILTRTLRNPKCRFDHEIYSPTPSLGRTLGDLLGPHGSISAVPRTFLMGAACGHCGSVCADVTTLNASSPMSFECSHCRKVSAIHPGVIRSTVAACELSEDLLRQTPHALGLRDGDFFAICEGSERRNYFLSLNSHS